MTDATKTAAKPRGKPFRKGNRANPNGRPTGSRNKASIMLDRMAEADAKEIARTLIDSAKKGDMRAAELVLSRVWPVRKGRPVSLSLPVIETVQDVVAALGLVGTAVGDGELTPEEGASVAAVLEIKRKAIETVELENRIAAWKRKRANDRAKPKQAAG